MLSGMTLDCCKNLSYFQSREGYERGAGVVKMHENSTLRCHVRSRLENRLSWPTPKRRNVLLALLKRMSRHSAFSDRRVGRGDVWSAIVWEDYREYTAPDCPCSLGSDFLAWLHGAKLFSIKK